MNGYSRGWEVCRLRGSADSATVLGSVFAAHIIFSFFFSYRHLSHYDACMLVHQIMREYKCPFRGLHLEGYVKSMSHGNKHHGVPYKYAEYLWCCSARSTSN